MPSLYTCGVQDVDFQELRRGAHYDGGYERSSQVVEWFWEVRWLLVPLRVEPCWRCVWTRCPCRALHPGAVLCTFCCLSCSRGSALLYVDIAKAR
jgi:hypothetical protein